MNLALADYPNCPYARRYWVLMRFWTAHLIAPRATPRATPRGRRIPGAKLKADCPYCPCKRLFDSPPAMR